MVVHAIRLEEYPVWVGRVGSWLFVLKRSRRRVVMSAGPLIPQGVINAGEQMLLEFRQKILELMMNNARSIAAVVEHTVTAGSSAYFSRNWLITTG